MAVIHSGMKMPGSKMEPVAIRKLKEPHGEWIFFDTVAAAEVHIGASRGHISSVLTGKRKHAKGWTARRESKPRVADGCKKCVQCCYVWDMKYFWSEKEHREVKWCYLCTQKDEDRRKKDPVYAAIAELWAEYKRRPCVDCGQTSEFIEADHVYGPCKWIWVKGKKKKICLSNITWWAQNGGVAAWMQEAKLTQPRRMDYHRIRTFKRAAAEKRGQPTATTSGATEQKRVKHLAQQKRNAEGRAHIDAIKRKIGVCQCGKEGCDKRVQPGMEFLFDFDHRDPAKKTINIGLMTSFSRERRETEITKCRLLYCLCHRAHTRQQHAMLVAQRLEAIAEMEQAKVVASTVDTLIATLTGPLAASAPPPEVVAAPTVPVLVAPKKRLGLHKWLIAPTTKKRKH